LDLLRDRLRELLRERLRELLRDLLRELLRDRFRELLRDFFFFFFFLGGEAERSLLLPDFARFLAGLLERLFRSSSSSSFSSLSSIFSFSALGERDLLSSPAPLSLAGGDEASIISFMML